MVRSTKLKLQAKLIFFKGEKNTKHQHQEQKKITTMEAKDIKRAKDYHLQFYTNQFNSLDETENSHEKESIKRARQGLEMQLNGRALTYMQNPKSNLLYHQNKDRMKQKT